MSEPSGSHPDAELKELFAQAVQLPTEKRTAFLDERCAGAPELRRAVESLLTVFNGAAGFLDAPHLSGARFIFDYMYTGTAIPSTSSVRTNCCLKYSVIHSRKVLRSRFSSAGDGRTQIAFLILRAPLEQRVQQADQLSSDGHNRLLRFSISLAPLTSPRR